MAESNKKVIDEWILQSDYDFKTAEAMFDTGRYIYCIFMCHLSLEKCLKALYCKALNKHPEKTHNLNYLINKIGLELPEELLSFIDNINNNSVPTRYPDDLQKVLASYKKRETKKILSTTKETLIWLKEKLQN